VATVCKYLFTKIEVNYEKTYTSYLLTFLPSYLLTFLLVIPAFAQPSYPAEDRTFNSFNNIFTGIKHPSLSLNGFNETVFKGNSLATIIDSLDDYRSQIALFDNLGGSEFDAKNPNDYELKDRIGIVEPNVIALEKQAFMALLTFAADQYHSSINHGFKAFSLIAGRLKQNLTKPHTWYVVNKSIQNSPDYVKWTSSMMNYARAIDLYLGLEILIRSHPNASQFSQYLLSDAEKLELMLGLKNVIEEGYEALYNANNVWLEYPRIVG
jgi:hypothetical protein